MSQQNVDIVKKAYEAFGQGDIEAVLAVFDPSIEWVSPVGEYRLAGVAKGPEAIVNDFFVVLGELWEALDVSPREIIDDGERVIVMGHATGKARATGTMVDTPYIHIYNLSNGKITRYEEFIDTALTNQATMPATNSVS